ncbi:ESPR-type extended signal peptide-containing protein [Veillonella atypica]|uniref:YadA-like family protein n=1 Tax=Veillonella atypica TaxID=39777 RepID=UPI00352FB75D
MNKIFKVIWSKSKQCYIVVSEIAKNKTGKKKIVVAGIFAALAMVNGGYLAVAATNAGGSGSANAVAWGSGSKAPGDNAIAIGKGANAAKNNTIAIGTNSKANLDMAVAVGNEASADTHGTAIGASAKTTGYGAFAGGVNAQANGVGAIAIGGATSDAYNQNAVATGESATAIGSSAIADGRGGVAVGWNAESKVNAVGIGFNAKAKANNTVAIGVEANNDKVNAISNNYSSVSIGVATRARAVGSMAMGVSADASGKYSIALGSGNVVNDYTATANYPKASGEKAIAIGYNSNSSNTAATAIGAGATANGQDSFAGGSGTAGGNSSIAIGKGASISAPPAGTTVGGQDSIAVGTGASAKQHSSITIGVGSTSDGVRNITIGPKASASGIDSIAIGNGGVGGDPNNTVTGGTGTTYNNIDVNGINTDVYYGVKSVDDGSIAFGNRANAAKGGLAIGTVSIADGGIAVGQSVLSKNGVAIGSAVSATAANAVALGSRAEASSVGAVAIGGYSATDRTKAQGNNAVAIGASAVTDGNETIAIGKSANASNANTVAVGKNANASKVNAVALGSDSTTDTNATRQANTTINGITYNFAGATSDTGMQVSVGAAGKERQIKNVATGEVSATSTDAINGSQLFAVASQIKPIQYFAVNSSVADNKDNTGATGSDSVAIGPKAKAQAMSSIALGNNAAAAGGNSIAIGNTSSATDKQSPISIGYGATANGDFSIAIGGGDNNTNYGATANGVGGTALGGKTKTTGGNFQTAVGFGATTTAQNASAFGYNATTSAEGGVALGFNSSSITGVNKGYNPNDNRTNKYDGLKNNVLTSTTGAIAVGNGSTVTRQITGVAAGTNDTDAVNVAQLKSVNLAFKGNVGNGDVNLATNDSDKKLTIQGDRTYITTNASGNILTISANKKDINVTNGTARADAGVADAKNVAEAINNAVSQNKYKWYLTADNDTGGSRSTIDKEGTVKFSGDSNINVSRNGNTITTSLNKAITVDSVKANKTITVGTNKITLDGNTGAVTGKAFNGDSFTSGNNVLTNTTLQIGSLTGGNNVTITRDGLTAKAGTKTVKFGTNGINAGDQQINNVASAGGVSTNAANYGDVKNAVSGVTLKINDGKPGSKDSTVNLSDQTLVVKGGTGIQTSVIGQTITVKLDNNTENATTKGIGIKGDSGFATKKYLKDGDVIFNVTGDGNLVKTSSTTTGVQVSVDSTKVKDLAVEAVTVSKANNISDNPITVTSKASTNSKDYAIGIDTTKLANKTNLAYTANGGTAKTVSLAKGLNFVDGKNTVSSVDSDGKVSFDLNQATKDSINKSATAVGRTITLNADSGTGSSQSLSNGNVSFAVSGTTGDYISTTMDGSAVKVSTKRATINSDANTGKASVTGADGLATAKNVASAINSAVNGLSQNLNISDGTKDSSVALKSQKLTITGTGAAKASVNGQTITIDVAEGTLTPNTTDGTVTGTTGVAKATEVAAAINNTNTVLGNKITKNTQDIATNTSNITANKNQITTNTTNIATNTANIAHTIALADDKGASTTAKSLKDGNVSFNIKGDNKFISTTASGNDVTLTVNEQAIKDAAKNASSFKVKANATAAEEVKGGDTIAFNNGDNIEISQTGKTFTIGTAKNITVDSVTAGNTVINTSGLTNGTTAITSTGITTDKVTVGGLSIDKTAGINAGGKVISNVASGNVNNNATDNSNAANIGDVKQAVANLSQNLNITDGTNNGTVDLKTQNLNVAGANGVTANVNNQTITVGLDADTVNATTKGVGLTGDTGSTGNKYLKDGDVSFAVTGDGNLVSTSATAAGVKVAVDAAKVKDLAVAAVTVSKDGQADNPITVTPTAGTNSMDYTIGIDTTKLAAKTDLTYRANSAADANAKKVSLSKGLNFVDGGSTVVTVDNDGKVSFDLNTATKTQINTNTTDIATNTAALARNISLGADTGTASSQSLSTADVAFNVKGATGDFVSTNMNGNTVEISTKRATINSNATTGEASVTGNDGLATAQNVADAINKAADAAKAGAAWNITTNSSTTDKTAVKGGDTVDLVNGDNIEITQDGTDKKKITVATKKDITVDSVTANNKVTVGSGANKITLDGTDGSVTGKAFTGTTFTGTSFTGTSFTAGNTVINTNGLTNGTTAITGNGVTTDNVTVGGISINKTAGINAGNKVISNVASGGTTLTNAANIGDVQNAVANLSQNLNITDGTNNGTVDLKNQKLNVAGANGVTAIVNNQTITVGLDAYTVNATTKGIGLTADNGSTGNKYLKDGDVSFAVTGDGSLVSTTATTAGVKVAVNSATITAGTDGTITGPTTDGVATAKNVADAINAAKKASKTEITANTGEAVNATTGNVTLTSTTAADGHTIYDVKLNDKVTLGTGANAVTIDGTTGAITGKTATIGGVTVNGTANTIGGLSNTTWNGTAVSGRAATEDQLKAATGATTLKFTGDVATNTGSVNLKDDTFGIKGDGKYISTDANGKNLTVKVSEAEVKKSAVAAVTVSTDTTDTDNPLTVTPNASADGTTKDYKVTIDGTKIANKTNLSYKANDGTAKQVSLADGLNFKNGTLTTASIDDNGVVKYDINTASITAGTDGTITGPTTDGVATAQNVADAINAAKKASKTEITANTGEAANATTGNVTLTSTTAADGHTIYDVKLNDKVTLGTGANAVTIDGTTGAITGKTANIGGVTVNGTANTIGGLSNTTWNGTATTGRAATEDQLKAVADTAKTTTDAVNLKFSGDTNTSPGVVNLKDDTLGIIGDGKYVSTDANGKNLTVKVSEAEVKKSAVAAVTVSTDTTDANNPLTVTPTTSADGTTKDYKVTIDGTKIANKTNLSYKANDGTPKQVSLADGLNFKNGTLTTASIDDNGVVKYDVNTASITAGTDGTITGPTTDGVATAKNVADAINAAKKASKTEITANTGEAANATTGNVTLTSTTAADGHTIYDVKLNDKVTLGTGANTVTIDGTAGKATIGTSIVDGVNNMFTTGGASPVTLNGATGTITGKTANIGGVSVNGTANTIGGLSNTTWNGTATTGQAATEDQLKAVADAAGSQTWEITADKKAGTSGVQTGTKENAKVGKDDKVSLIAGENLTVDQAGKNLTYSLNKDLVKMNSATFEATGGKTTVIKGGSIVQTDGAKTNTSNATSNTITDGTNTSTITAGKTTIGSSIIDGVNKTFTTGGNNAVTMDGAAGTIKTGAVTVTGGTTNDITGLSNTTVTGADFATKGRAATEEQLKAATGATTLKFTGDVVANTGSVNLKDDTFGIKGDGKYVSTDTNGKNLIVKVSEAEVKKSAVAAVTVSTDTTDADNLLTVTPNASADGTTKDYKVTIDGTKIANKTNLSYKANDGTAKQVSLADGLNFKNGTLTTADIDDNGVVKYDVNTASITAGADGTITGPTKDGVATAQNVADAINAAKKASTTEITANTGEAANATTGNVTLTSTTAADGHTIYDVKLNDKVTLGTGANAVTVDGTAGKATIGSSIIDGVNNTFITGGASPVTLNGATGTITGKAANIGGVTVDGTNNHVMGLANKDWTPGVTQAVSGRAATEDQLQKVSDAVGAGWKVNTGKVTGSTGESNGAASTKVSSGEEVQFQAGNNLIVDQNGKTVAYSLNKALKDLESATFNGTGTNTTVITGDSITQTAGTQTNTSTAAGNTVTDGTKSTETTADGQVIKDGAKSNKSTVDNNVIDDGNGNVNTSNATSNTITDGTNTTATTSSSVTVKDNAGNSTVITKDNVTTGVGGNKITLDGTAGKATIGSSIVDGVNNTFTTGGTNAVIMNGAAGTIKTGTVTVTGGTTNDITGLSNTTVNSADFATKGRAATEEQLKAVGEQTWQITADKDRTTSGAQTGTKKDAKVGKDNKVQLIAGENMTINQNERDFTFTLNKDLVKMNSATFLGTGSNTTVITGNSITQTAGTQTNTFTAGGNTVADGTKSTETTATGQVIKDGNKSNKSTVDSNIIDDGNGNKNTSNATSNTITDGTNTSTITAGKANIGNIAVDGVNNKITMGNGATPVTLDGANGHLDGLTNTTWVPGVTKATTGRAATEDQLQQVSDAVGAGWKVNTGTVAGSSGVSNGAASTKVSSGEEVKLQAGDNLVIDQNGKTVSYSLNKDLTKMNSATFEATGGKTTVIKGDSIVQTDGGKTNTSNAAGNTVVDSNKSTATTAAGTTITDGAKTNISTADKNVIDDGAGNKSTFTKDGITITKAGKDTVSLTSNGLDNGKNKIVNVAAGVANTDAVNVGQLKEYAAKSTTELTANNGEAAGSTTGNIVLTKTTAADGHTIYDNKLNDKITLGTDPTKAVTVDGTTGTVTGLTNKTWTPGSIVSGRAATEDQLKNAVADSGWKVTVGADDSGKSTVVGTSPEKIKAEETVTFKAGNNMMVTQTGKSISYAVNPDLTDMKSATFKDAAGNTTVTNGNGITITPGSANPTNPHAGPVSLTKDGLNNGNNQIKGVAPGTDPTDAVNVAQLNASNANTSQAINQVAGEVQHVGAHAAAMAALKPIQYDPLEPTQIMAGVGNYRGETAAALGLAHYTNENTMFNVGVSVGGNHNMVNAGVTHKFGYSPEKKNIPDRYKAGPISSVYVMQDEVSSLKKENAEQKYVIADQAARLTTLEAENEQQRRELAETKKGLDDLKAAVDKLLASKG